MVFLASRANNTVAEQLLSCFQHRTEGKSQLSSKFPALHQTGPVEVMYTTSTPPALPRLSLSNLAMLSQLGMYLENLLNGRIFLGLYWADAVAKYFVVLMLETVCFLYVLNDRISSLQRPI